MHCATRYKRPESILIVVYTQAGEVLLLERAHPAGFWQSITGSLRWDETPAAAAKRELHEETGLSDVPVEDCRHTYRFPILPAWRHRYDPLTTENIEHLFKAELIEAPRLRLNPAEHTAYRWLPLTAALQEISSATNHDALRRVVVHAETVQASLQHGR